MKVNNNIVLFNSTFSFFNRRYSVGIKKTICQRYEIFGYTRATGTHRRHTHSINSAEEVKDMEEFARLRQIMVQQQLIRRGIADPNVIAAMKAVPRHEFVPLDFKSRSYADTPLPIGFEQTISQPYMVAFMTEVAMLSKDDIVMEVGSGCGYAAAVASLIAHEVFSYEIVKPLGEAAKVRVAQLGYKNLHIECGDGLELSQGKGPFNAILVTACSPDIPTELKSKLAIRGRLILPVGKNDRSSPQILTRVTRVSEEHFTEEDLEYVMFVPLTRDRN
jgi:protein-L-isoaspartate(D-aspartate) O-methyltransferase